MALSTSQISTSRGDHRLAGGINASSHCAAAKLLEQASALNGAVSMYSQPMSFFLLTIQLFREHPQRIWWWCCSYPASTEASFHRAQSSIGKNLLFNFQLPHLPNLIRLSCCVRLKSKLQWKIARVSPSTAAVKAQKQSVNSTFWCDCFSHFLWLILWLLFSSFIKNWYEHLLPSPQTPPLFLEFWNTQSNKLRCFHTITVSIPFNQFAIAIKSIQIYEHFYSPSHGYRTQCSPPLRSIPAG